MKNYSLSSCFSKRSPVLSHGNVCRGRGALECRQPGGSETPSQNKTPPKKPHLTCPRAARAAHLAATVECVWKQGSFHIKWNCYQITRSDLARFSLANLLLGLGLEQRAAGLGPGIWTAAAGRPAEESSLSVNTTSRGIFLFSIC